jgi:flavin reductase (DIM6/NTAB) family NADH-FMN oxidoreductase RutF
VLARHAAGVVVITVADGGGPAGLTVTSFTSASLRPPLVSCWVDERSETLPKLRSAGLFAVNILSGGQPETAARFAGRRADRFAPPTRWRPGPYGLPVLDGIAAFLACRPHSILKAGDHHLILGLVVHAEALGRTDDPLLYHHGAYGRFLPAPSEPAAAHER